MHSFSSFLLLGLTASIGLCACSTIKRYTPDLSAISVPKFSALKKVTRILPGMPDADSAGEEDPKMPFDATSTLGYGHTLRLHVYEGARSVKRVYNGVVMIDGEGVLTFEGIGKAKVGGGTLLQAADAIAATMRMGLHLTRPVTVHILSVEDTPLISVTGDVARELFLPAWDGLTLPQAVAAAGGRKAGSSARSVYLIREGNRRFYPSLEAAASIEPEPGDILHLSPDF